MNNLENNTTSNTNTNASQAPSVWTARKGETILAQSDSENGAWRLLGARGKKQREMLKTVGFEVVSV